MLVCVNSCLHCVLENECCSMTLVFVVWRTVQYSVVKLSRKYLEGACCTSLLPFDKEHMESSGTFSV